MKQALLTTESSCFLHQVALLRSASGKSAALLSVAVWNGNRAVVHCLVGVSGDPVGTASSATLHWRLS